MKSISGQDIQARIERDNSWWAKGAKSIVEAAKPRRVYFGRFKGTALNFNVKRATVLLGPRRVGKTYMIKQLIHDIIVDGFNPKHILYASIDTPVYSGISLENILITCQNFKMRRLA